MSCLDWQARVIAAGLYPLWASSDAVATDVKSCSMAGIFAQQVSFDKEKCSLWISLHRLPRAFRVRGVFFDEAFGYMTKVRQNARCGVSFELRVFLPHLERNPAVHDVNGAGQDGRAPSRGVTHVKEWAGFGTTPNEPLT